MPGIYSHLAELIRDNKPAALATVISGERTGTKMLVPVSGPKTGSILENLDDQVAQDALSLITAEKSEIRVYTAGEQTYEVFIETFPPPQRLIIVGAVHVAIPLHRLAKTLGYHVTVIDPRGMLATPERFPEADSILVEWPDDAISTLSLDRGASVVVLTHDPKFDQPALRAALSSEARYIGAIGSRDTNSARMEELREAGVTDQQIGRIFAPIGLNIGGRSPAEIALSIMGEIVAARYNRPGGHMRPQAAQR